MIPLAISAYQNPQIRLGITLYVLAAALSIFFAVISLMPKRYQTDSGGKSNLLHFSGIWQYLLPEEVKNWRKIIFAVDQVLETGG